MDCALLPDEIKRPARALPAAVAALVAGWLTLPSSDAQAEPRENKAIVEAPAEEQPPSTPRSKKEKCAELAKLTGFSEPYCEQVMKTLLVDLLLWNVKQDQPQADHAGRDRRDGR